MRTIEIGDATQSLARYAKRGRQLPLVVTDHGRPVAALLAMPNTDRETASLSANPKFLALIERSRKKAAQKGGIPSAEIRKRLRVRPSAG